MFVSPQLMMPFWPWSLTPLYLQGHRCDLSAQALPASECSPDPRWSSITILLEVEMIMISADAGRRPPRATATAPAQGPDLVARWRLCRRPRGLGLPLGGYDCWPAHSIRPRRASSGRECRAPRRPRVIDLDLHLPRCWLAAATTGSRTRRNRCLRGRCLGGRVGCRLRLGIRYLVPSAQQSAARSRTQLLSGSALLSVPSSWSPDPLSDVPSLTCWNVVP